MIRSTSNDIKALGILGFQQLNFNQDVLPTPPPPPPHTPPPSRTHTPHNVDIVYKSRYHKRVLTFCNYALCLFYTVHGKVI